MCKPGIRVSDCPDNRISGWPTAQQTDIRVFTDNKDTLPEPALEPCEACAQAGAVSEAAQLLGRLAAQRSDRCQGSSLPVALAARDASTNLTEWDETMAVETRGGAEASMETLCNVWGLDSQWADFARRICVR